MWAVAGIGRRRRAHELAAATAVASPIEHIRRMAHAIDSRGAARGHAASYHATPSTRPFVRSFVRLLRTRAAQFLMQIAAS